MPESLVNIRVTDIGEYIRHDCCARRFKLNLDDMALPRLLPFFNRLFNPLDLVLQQSGREKEDEWEKELKHAGFVNLTPQKDPTSKSSSSGCSKRGTEWAEFVACLSNLDSMQPAYSRNVCVGGNFGAFHLRGEMDFLIILWDQTGTPRLKIVECKASRRDRTYHRIQVVLYYLLVSDLIEKGRISVGGKALFRKNIDCLVARIDEITNKKQSILDLQPLDQKDVAQLMEDITYLLAGDGRLKRIASSDISSLDYQLNEKCDTCIFDVYCLPNSGIERRLELLGTQPGIARDLREGGVADIDQLAGLDLESPQASDIRGTQGFLKSLEALKVKALIRRSTLPGEDPNNPVYKVTFLPFSGYGQLPDHTIDGNRLVRIYLSVDYDYVEDRVGALAAHVTNSRGAIHTAFVQSENRWRPDSSVKERWQDGEHDANYNSVEVLNKRYCKQVVRYKKKPWTGLYDQDTESERELIEDFLHSLVDSITAVAQVDAAPIHFYVWSRSEMTRLVEACVRSSTVLLGHLNELLGCREGLDQLIFSCLGEEVNNRYALGWTAGGLVVATSLPWFGRRFHWWRRVNGQDVDLERVFTQDLFDFKTKLGIEELPIQSADSPYTRYCWAGADDLTCEKHRFEIRSRFHDSLPAPYWRAVWKTLPEPEEQNDPKMANAIKRYNEASKPHYLESYLAARTQALRWIEELMRGKNREISKPIMDLNKIKEFSLEIDSISQASVDFLRLDSNVKVRDWTAEHLMPPAYRISSGHTIPIKILTSRWNADRKQEELVAKITLKDFGVDPGPFAASSSFAEGDFVRVSPHSGDPTEGQRLVELRNDGLTCVIRALNWSSLQAVLGIITVRSDRYRLPSAGYRSDRLTNGHATIDESPSDFVAPRVEEALLESGCSFIDRWFDTLKPLIPSQPKLAAKTRAEYNQLLKTWRLPGGPLHYRQRQACVDGLDARIQLIHGPPGTGKTITTATAILVRALSSLKVGDVVLLAANTHTALNILLEDVASLKASFAGHATLKGYRMPRIKLAKYMSSPDNPRPVGNIDIIESKPYTSLKAMLSDSVAVVGGTVSGLLKLWKKKGERLADLQTVLLVVDEASMMVLPNFLALASLLDPDRGNILLAGDHQQLPPIISHDWVNEDRPPVVLYQPYTSAYVGIQSIGNKLADPTKVTQSALEYSYRLPPEIRELINYLYGRERALQGRPGAPYHGQPVASEDLWSSVWHGETGLYLVTHNEEHSKLSNSVEAYIVKQILARSNICSPRSVAIVTPHRAQRGLLKYELGDYANPDDPSRIVDSINTVEHFQGGQRDIVIVSASESDPSAISASTRFILDLKRSNVAFSRPRTRLIVVCSQALLDFIPSEADDYEATLLWRSLRRICSREIGSESIEVDGSFYFAKIFTYDPSW